jgi:hypothetical protein
MAPDREIPVGWNFSEIDAGEWRSCSPTTLIRVHVRAVNAVFPTLPPEPDIDSRSTGNKAEKHLEKQHDDSTRQPKDGTQIIRGVAIERKKS